MDEGVVERRVDVRHREHILALLGLHAKRDGRRLRLVLHFLLGRLRTARGQDARRRQARAAAGVVSAVTTRCVCAPRRAAASHGLGRRGMAARRRLAAHTIASTQDRRGRVASTSVQCPVLRKPPGLPWRPAGLTVKAKASVGSRMWWGSHWRELRLGEGGASAAAELPAGHAAMRRLNAALREQLGRRHRRASDALGRARRQAQRARDELKALETAASRAEDGLVLAQQRLVSTTRALRAAANASRAAKADAGELSARHDAAASQRHRAERLLADERARLERASAALHAAEESARAVEQRARLARADALAAESEVSRDALAAVDGLQTRAALEAHAEIRAATLAELEEQLALQRAERGVAEAVGLEARRLVDALSASTDALRAHSERARAETRERTQALLSARTHAVQLEREVARAESVAWGAGREWRDACTRASELEAASARLRAELERRRAAARALDDEGASRAAELKQVRSSVREREEELARERVVEARLRSQLGALEADELLARRLEGQAATGARDEAEAAHRRAADASARASMRARAERDITAADERAAAAREEMAHVRDALERMAARRAEAARTASELRAQLDAAHAAQHSAGTREGELRQRLRRQAAGLQRAEGRAAAARAAIEGAEAEAEARGRASSGLAAQLEQRLEQLGAAHEAAARATAACDEAAAERARAHAAVSELAERRDALRERRARSVAELAGRVDQISRTERDVALAERARSSLDGVASRLRAAIAETGAHCAELADQSAALEWRGARTLSALEDEQLHARAERVAACLADVDVLARCVDHAERSLAFCRTALGHEERAKRAARAHAREHDATRADAMRTRASNQRKRSHLARLGFVRELRLGEIERLMGRTLESAASAALRHRPSSAPRARMATPTTPRVRRANGQTAAAAAAALGIATAAPKASASSSRGAGTADTVPQHTSPRRRPRQSFG